MNEPMNLGTNDTHEGRLSGESRATGLLDGRTIHRRGRDVALALKVTSLKKQQLLRLSVRTQLSMTEIIEAGIDLYEQKLDTEFEK
jgi:hypothetical protein